MFQDMSQGKAHMLQGMLQGMLKDMPQDMFQGMPQIEKLGFAVCGVPKINVLPAKERSKEIKVVSGQKENFWICPLLLLEIVCWSEFRFLIHSQTLNLKPYSI